MIKPRTIVLTAMLGLPILVYVTVGLYAILQVGLFRWIWWLLPACWFLTWGLSRLWKPDNETDFDALPPSSHWTERDKSATRIVRRYQQRIDSIDMKQLADPHFFVDEMTAMATDLSRHYHPRTNSPLDSLTVPEVLAATRLAVSDVERWALEYAPGSRMLTIGQWKSFRHAPRLFKRLQNLGWATSIFLNPSNLGLYFSSKLSTQPVTRELTQDLMVMLYTRFVRQVGFYLIEMNSGRLRGGADVYLRAFGKSRERDAATDSFSTDGSVTTDGNASPEGDVSPEGGAASVVASARDQGPTAPVEESADAFIRAERVTIALVGQVSAGKSSLINALTGRTAVEVDNLPSTKSVSRHRIPIDSNSTGTDSIGPDSIGPDSPGPDSIAEDRRGVVLLDTPGYGEAGASKQQLRQIQSALEESDAVLLLMDGHSPAREPDRRTISDLRAAFADQPHLKLPPVLGVLTHVDLLPPSLEWNPPYDWKQPQREKEKQMAEAIEYAREIFGDQLSDCVPVCLSANAERRWGIQESLLPALASLVKESQSVALLRAFEAHLDAGRIATLMVQIRSAGAALLRQASSDQPTGKDRLPASD